MATLNVSLTPELAELVREKVDSGMYHSASEVVREGLRLLREQDEIHRARLYELRNEIEVGTAQLDRGEVTVYPSGRELAAKIRAAGRNRARDSGRD